MDIYNKSYKKLRRYEMISDRVKIKVNYMNYDRLDKLANWLINRYWQKKEPALAQYIIARHYYWEEGMAGML